MKATGASYRVALRHDALPEPAHFTCAAGRTVLEAARAAGVILQTACERGGCGACRAQLIEGTFAYVAPVSAGALATARGGAAACLLMCRATPTADLVLAPLAPWKLTRVRALSAILGSV